MQDAYASETGNLGTWTNIGYKMDNSASFTYGGSDVKASTTCAEGGTYADGKCSKTEDGKSVDVAVSGAALTKGWTVNNVVKLNDCAPGENWSISASIGEAASNTGSVEYTGTIGSADCEMLTPSFSKIGGMSATVGQSK